MKQYIAEYIVPVEKKGNDCMFDFMNTKPLIRCKDCKWWREDSDHTCKHFCTSPRVANDLCSRAEPKESYDH